MKLTRILKFTFSFIAVCSFASLAQAKPLPLKDVIRLGLENSPELKSAQANERAASADTKEKIGGLFPSIGAKAIGTSRDNAANSSTSPTASSEEYQAYLEARQPLYSGGAISSGLSLFRTKEDIARLEKASAQQNLISDLITLYYDSAEGAQLSEAAQEHIDILQSYARIIIRYQKIGRAKKTDRLQAEVNLQTALADQASINSSLNEKLESLRSKLQLSELPEGVDSSTLNIQTIEKLSPQDAISAAVQTNPELLSKRKAQDVAKEEKILALASDMPNVYLAGQLGYRSGVQSDLFESTSKYNSISINLEIPLFSGLSSLNKRQSYEEKKIVARLDYEKNKRDTESEARTAIRDLSASFDRLTFSRKAATQAREALTLANRDYEKGLISSLDVVSIQRTRYDSEKLLIRTQFEYLKILLKLRKLMGINLEKIYG